MKYPKPKIGTYPDYYNRYTNLVPENNLIETLEEQATTTQELLMNLTNEQGNYRYALEKWSVKELINHLSDTERIMCYRILCFARDGKISLPGFDENIYAAASLANSRTLDDVLEEFVIVRHATIALIKSLDETMWNKSGIANQTPVVVSAIAYMIAGHELHHRNILLERYFVKK